jgi:hypothetical protein
VPVQVAQRSIEKRSLRLHRRQILVVVAIIVVVIAAVGYGVYYLYQLPPSWATVQEIATFASGLGVAIFTGVVALVEVARFLQGPKISVILSDTLELKTRIIARTKEAYREFREEITFQFPVVFANIGSRGGAVTGVEFELLSPSAITPTTRDGQISSDNISFDWKMGDVPPQYAADQTFASSSPGVLSIKDNESKALLATINFRIRDADSQTRYPSSTLSKAPQIRLKLKCTVTSGRKGTQVLLEKQFTIKPEFTERREQ